MSVFFMVWALTTYHIESCLCLSERERERERLWPGRTSVLLRGERAHWYQRVECTRQEGPNIQKQIAVYKFCLKIPPGQPYEQRRNFIDNIAKRYGNLVFQAYTSFLRFVRQGNLRKCWQFPISFSSRRVSPLLSVSDTKVEHFWYLACSQKNCIAHMEQLLGSHLAKTWSHVWASFESLWGHFEGPRFYTSPPPTLERTLLGVEGMWGGGV